MNGIVPPWLLPATLQDAKALAGWQWGRTPSRWSTTTTDTTILAALAVMIEGAVL